MSKIKFGPAQRKFPIPRSVDWKIGLGIEICGWAIVVFNSELVDMMGMNETWQHMASQGFGLVVALLIRIKPWFGMETKQKKVDIEHVEVMEDKPK